MKENTLEYLKKKGGRMNNSALIIIDMQNGVVGRAYHREEIVKNILRLIESARMKSIKIIWVQHEDEQLIKNSDDWKIIKELNPQVEDFHIFKNYGDAFDQTHLKEILEQNKIEKIFVTGAQTEACVRATLHGAFVRGYNTVLVSDAHTTEDLTEYGLPKPEVIVNFTNMYWKFQNGSKAKASVVKTNEVEF